jgi:hypothetical protein
MECKNIQNQFLDYLDKSLLEVANSKVEHHLKSCENCNKEFEEIKSFDSILRNQQNDIPSNNLRLNFEKMLTEEIKENKTKVIAMQPKIDWKSHLKIAASVLIILSAFLLGKYQSNASLEFNNQQNVLASLEDNSASKRILAVANAEEYTSKDTKIVKALINRLFFDKNTNVRLAAAEALSKFSSETIVRDALIKALETDKNTSVQIELITILSKIKEKRAIKPMEKMLENEETPLYVKQQLQLNLSSLL